MRGDKSRAPSRTSPQRRRLRICRTRPTSSSCSRAREICPISEHRHDQPSGDYETCQHPVAKNRYTSHHVAAVSRPCRERVVSMSRHVATCRERVAGMSRRVASVSRRVAGMSRACRGHVATCRAASCDVTQRRKVSPHRPTQPLAAWPLK